MWLFRNLFPTGQVLFTRGFLCSYFKYIYIYIMFKRYRRDTTRLIRRMAAFRTVSRWYTKARPSLSKLWTLSENYTLLGAHTNYARPLNWSVCIHLDRWHTHTQSAVDRAVYRVAGSDDDDDNFRENVRDRVVRGPLSSLKSAVGFHCQRHVFTPTRIPLAVIVIVTLTGVGVYKMYIYSFRRRRRISRRYSFFG